MVAWLQNLPYVGPVVKVLVAIFTTLFIPLTYYQIDIQQLVHNIVHQSITQALDDLANARGVRPLVDIERMPIMADILRLPR
jgi:hypothetical protein